jgi:hypothetical protein
MRQNTEKFGTICSDAARSKTTGRVVEKVLRRLRSEGEHAAAERIESFFVPDRAELHGIIGYDS